MNFQIAQMLRIFIQEPIEIKVIRYVCVKNVRESQLLSSKSMQFLKFGENRVHHDENQYKSFCSN